jgi:deoxyribonuclease V
MTVSVRAELVHQWDLAPQEAAALQERLAAQVIRENQLGPVTSVAGVDVGIRADTAQAAIVVLSYPQLELVDYALATRPVTFPYVPGLLSFREGSVILEALEKVTRSPGLLIFDGQGIAHPRRLGIASHIGLLVDLPTIGCAKSRLCGSYEDPDFEWGSYTFLTDKGEIVGAVVRTRSGVKPVFVSIGHRIDLSTSVDYVLNCCRGYRLPETTRWAHRLAGGATPPAVQPRLFPD